MEAFVGHFQIFLVLWARVLAIVMVVPPLSSLVIPARVKFTLSFLFAVLLYPSVAKTGNYFELLNLPVLIYFLVIFKELMVGLIIGFLIGVFMAVFELTAEIFSMQMGLSFASVVDPSNNQETPLLGSFFYAFITFLFFDMGGVHMILSALHDSYVKAPVMLYAYNGEEFINLAVKYFGMLFALALKIALPVIMMAVLVMVVLGLLGRVAPQANLLMLGMPLQWGVGVLMLLVVAPFAIDLFLYSFPRVLSDSIEYVSKAVRSSRA